MYFRAFLLAIALSLAVPSALAAPSKKKRARVVQLVKESAAHYEAGRFSEAIPLLREAYSIEPNPTILYNLARAYEGQGDSKSAVEAYQKYLDEAPKAEDRGSVERRIATLSRQLDEKAALERERDLAAKRAADARREAERAEREKKSAPPPKHEPSVVPWIVAGVGAAVIGGGAFFGLRARSKHDDAQSAELARDAANANDEAKTFALLANISFAAGGALLVGGVSWGVIDRSAGSDARGVVVTGRF